MEIFKEKLNRVTSEELSIVPHDPIWSKIFQEERRHLLSCLAPELIKRIEHFGSTAVPGLPAKPIIDILVEVTDLEETKNI